MITGEITVGMQFRQTAKSYLIFEVTRIVPSPTASRNKIWFRRLDGRAFSNHPVQSESWWDEDIIRTEYERVE